MKLVMAHKILIRTSLVFGIIFTGWSIRTWSLKGDIIYGAVGILTAASTVALYVYLKNFVKKNP